MASTEKSIDVNVPIRMAYNQWTQFEDFPRFMQGVQAVQQLDDKRLHWCADIGGKTEEWDAEIVEQTPDQAVAWRSTSGAENAGRITFLGLGPDATRVTLQLQYTPRNATEKTGDMLGVVSRQVDGDLKRFKEYIEARGAETGGWRGEIHDGEVQRSGTTSGVTS